MAIVIALALSYIFGSLNGARIREKLFRGEHNAQTLERGQAGASHTFRTKGRIAGIFVFAWDLGKGMFLVFIGKALEFPPWAIILLCGIPGMVGHNLPVFFRGQGGKGLAIMGGVLFLLHPPNLLLAFIASGLLFLWEKQKIGFMPFLAVPVYMGSLLIQWSWREQEIDWKFILTGIAVLAAVFVSRLYAEWEGLCQALPKRKAIRCILIYDRIDEYPPPRPEKVDWLISKLTSLFNRGKSPPE
jgi:acyl phosphate:glycerol-3-phosphate acyltransferase